jgi:hypothetical protein
LIHQGNVEAKHRPVVKTARSFELRNEGPCRSVDSAPLPKLPLKRSSGASDSARSCLPTPPSMPAPSELPSGAHQSIQPHRQLRAGRRAFYTEPTANSRRGTNNLRKLGWQNYSMSITPRYGSPNDPKLAKGTQPGYRLLCAYHIYPSRARARSARSGSKEGSANTNCLHILSFTPSSLAYTWKPRYQTEIGVISLLRHQSKSMARNDSSLLLVE